MFFFYYIGITLITILEAITGSRHTITFAMNTLKGEKMFFFEVTSQKDHKLIYINDKQRCSDNKYVNKEHNIIKGLSGTLNYNK